MTKEELEQSWKELQAFGESVGEKAGKVLTVYGWVTSGKDIVNDIGVMAGIWEEEKDPISTALDEIKDKLIKIIGKLNELLENTNDIYDAIVISQRQEIVRELRRMSIEIENITEVAVEYANDYASLPDDNVEKAHQYALMFEQKLEQENLLEALQSDSNFEFLFNKRWAYYNWLNEMMPPPELRDFGRSTWDYRFTLPLLQKAVVDRLMFNAVLFPHYRKPSHYEAGGGRYVMEDIYKVASKLIEVHEKVTEAIQEVPCPTLDQMQGDARFDFHPDPDSSVSRYKIHWRPVFCNDPTQTRIGEATYRHGRWSRAERQYGAVELYSNTAAVKTYRFSEPENTAIKFPYFNCMTPLGFPQLPPLLTKYWQWGKMHLKYEDLDAEALSELKESISGQYHIEYDYFRTQNWTLLQTQQAIFDRYHRECEKAYNETFLKAHTVRSYGQSIAVYRGLNLEKLWSFIQTLKHFGGGNLIRYASESNRKPLAGRSKPYLEGWSLRYLAGLLNRWYTRVESQPISLRQIIKVLDDGTASSNSLRQALEA